MIVKDINQLKEKCVPVSALSYGEGEDIAKQLLDELSNFKSGIGLAANQIGINKRVCVINVTKEEPLILINPEIIERSEETFVFPEGCLSFPNKFIRTIRHTSITVKADNHDTELKFTANSKDLNDAFLCACVQHEIDHLDGITMFDREFKQEPIKRKNKKIGRNHLVTIKRNDAVKVLKYKKAEMLLEDGWILQD
jgi:peptide deformylase